MGSKKEFNWVLKLKETLENLAESEVRTFEKAEERIYPINMPIMLADGDWNIVAAVEILKYQVSNNKTSGEYKVKRLFNPAEREILTQLHKEFYS